MRGGTMQPNPLTPEELQRLSEALHQQQAQQAGAGGGPDASQQAQQQGALGAMIPLEACGGQVEGEEEEAHGAGASAGPLPVFISHVEKRVSSHSSKPSKKSGAGGHSYVVRFYLVDASGGEHLAAEGEDQGDAHYLYTNQPAFPFLQCHNKAEVVAWLEDIQEASKLRAGYHTELVLDRAPSDPAAIRLPIFVAYRHEKLELPDGRHVMHWFLIDKLAHEHLAVTGEEKETRDGHYSYRTQGAFNLVRPLECGNQHEVARWLDAMVVPHHAEGAHHGGKHTQGGARRADSAGGSIRSDTTGGRSGLSGSIRRAGASASAKASGKKTGHKRGGAGGEDLLRAATTNLKRKQQAAAAAPAAAAGGGFQAAAQQAAAAAAAAADFEARELVSGELRKWAQEEAVKREGAKQAALNFLTDSLKDGELRDLNRVMGVLRQACAQPALVPATCQDATHQQILFLVELLGALRQLAHMYVPLRAITQPQLMHWLGTLKASPNPEVSLLAEGILEQWLGSIVAHTLVLSSDRYVEDPRKTLAVKLDEPGELERLVAEITRRPQRGPQQVPAQLLVQHAQQRSAPADTYGMLRAAGLAGGAPEAATPAALGGKAAPPGQALAGLGEGDAAHTVERRRLELDTPAGGAPSAQQAEQHQQAQQLGRGVPRAMEPEPSQGLLDTLLPMEMEGQLL